MVPDTVKDPLESEMSEEARQYSSYEEGGKSPYDLYGALRIVIIISSLSQISSEIIFN